MAQQKITEVQIDPALIAEFRNKLNTVEVDARVQAGISTVVGGAPGTLDTLKELSTALGNDPNFATTMTNTLSNKVDKTDPRLSDSRQPLAHNHSIGDIINLRTELDNKVESLRGAVVNNYLYMSSESGKAVTIPYFMNDIAYNNLRGGSTKLFVDGVESATSLDICFEPTSGARSLPVTPTEYVVEIDLWRTFTYGTKVGFAAMESWRSRYMKIEALDKNTDTWKVCYENDAFPGGDMLTSVPGNSAGGITKLRYTFRDFVSTSFRIGQLFLINYSSEMGSAFFLPRGGGDMYGNIKMLAAAPTAADHLVRKDYVDALVALKANQDGATFNVRDHGAVGNGVADDRAAILSALNAAQAAGGGIVVFPPGTYKVSATIGNGNTSYDNIAVRSMGRYAAKIVSAGDFPPLSGSWYRSTIQDLALDAGGFGSPAVNVHMVESLIDGCLLDGWRGFGMRLNDGTYGDVGLLNVVANNHIVQNEGIGIFQTYRWIDSWIVDNNVGSSDVNLSIEGGPLRVLGNHFDGAPLRNIDLRGNKRVIISSNICEGSREEAIRYVMPPWLTEDNPQVIISNNNISNGGKGGAGLHPAIRVQGVSDTARTSGFSVVGNLFACEDEGSGWSHAVLFQDADACVVNGNQWESGYTVSPVGRLGGTTAIEITGNTSGNVYRNTTADVAGLDAALDPNRYVATYTTGDFNTLDFSKPGNYKVQTGAGKVTNGPSTSALWWNITVLHSQQPGDTNSMLILASTTSASSVYTRVKYGATWGSWVTMQGASSAMTLAEAQTGTATTARFLTAQILKQIMGWYTTGSTTVMPTAVGQALAGAIDKDAARAAIDAQQIGVVPTIGEITGLQAALDGKAGRALGMVGTGLPWSKELIINGGALKDGYNDAIGGTIVDYPITLTGMTFRIADPTKLIAGTGNLTIQWYASAENVLEGTLVNTTLIPAGQRSAFIVLETPLNVTNNMCLRAKITLGSTTVDSAVHIEWRGRYQ